MDDPWILQENCTKQSKSNSAVPCNPLNQVFYIQKKNLKDESKNYSKMNFVLSEIMDPKYAKHFEDFCSFQTKLKT